MKTKQRNQITSKPLLRSYLAVTAGVGCAASVANGAVTFYGIDSANQFNADPIGISVGFLSNIAFLDSSAGYDSYFGISGGVLSLGTIFTSGGDLDPNDNRVGAAYFLGGYDFLYGATAGNQNYANVSFDGNDNEYEAVAQFFFDGEGNGFLIAIATLDEVPNPQDLSAVGGTTLSISDGKALIDAASIPEPSGLALLALGSAGLAARRRRKAA